MMSKDLKHPRFIVGMVIGGNIRRLREEAGLSQRELADQCLAHGMKWPSSRISNAETGAIPLNAAHELIALQEVFADLLKRPVSLDEFNEPFTADKEGTDD